jgi:hypothetical protein
MFERESGFETPQQRFEREVVAPTKRAMEDAISQATSEEDAVNRIIEVLPESCIHMVPLVSYMDMGEGKQRKIFASVEIRSKENELSTKIEVSLDESKEEK